MEQTKNIRYRIKFSKHSGMIFIGHLDLMRYFQKAIRRSGIPIAYSKGFSPHQIMSFAAPLGVGKFTNGDYMDIELLTETDTGVIKNRLSQTMSEGVEILNVVKLPDNADNAMATLFASGFTIRFRKGHENCLDTVLAKADAINKNHRFEHFEEFLSQEHIIYHKVTKKSEIDLDLKEGLYEHKVQPEEYVYVIMNTSSSGSIKPIHLMEAYADYVGVHHPREIDFVITREEMYLQKEDGSLAPMDEV